LLVDRHRLWTTEGLLVVTVRIVRDLVLAAIVAALLAAATAALTRAQAGDAQAAAPRQACVADVERLCPGVPRGGGRIRRCIVEKYDQLSDGCKAAMAAARALSKQK
jgi:hypothetical protein